MIRPKPKPEPKSKKKANKRRGICAECGFIWVTTPDHYDFCTQEGDNFSVNKYRSENQLYELALDDLCRRLTAWRDGVVCVINSHECRGMSQWGHVIPQGKSNYLKHNLSNSFRQCEGHNSMHRFVQTPYFIWYKNYLGDTAFEDLDEARQAFNYYKWRPDQMHKRLLEYNKLWKNRHEMVGADLKDLIREKYYGDIVLSAWKKDGRL